MLAAIAIPPRLAATITGVYGERGRRWVASAPGTIDALCRRWDVDLSPPFANLSYNYVAPGTLPDGTPVVLKVGVPSAAFQAEATALRHYEGRGAVGLLHEAPEAAALLLQRAQPGHTLATLDDDDRETRVAAQLIRRLWRPPPPGARFPSLEALLRVFERQRARNHDPGGIVPPDLFARATERSADLLATSPAPVLLHGDLHHNNILDGGDAGWLAIDPAGTIGDPAAEPGMFLCNPHGRLDAIPDLAPLMARRVRIFAAELGLPPARIAAWGVVWATMSACWHVEDGTAGAPHAIRCARVLSRLG